MRESRSSAVLAPADATSTALMTCSRALALSRGAGPFGFGSSFDVPEITVTPEGGTRTTSRTVSRELTTKAPTMNATAATATTLAANRAQTTLVGSVSRAITTPSPRRWHRSPRAVHRNSPANRDFGSQRDHSTTLDYGHPLVTASPPVARYE